ncbi:MAG: ATP-binding protein [Coriobacteriia bacterium]|nr:ATP-binding protein [Coriobacteriia bacterium]
MSPTMHDYAELVREARAFVFPHPSERIDVIRELPAPALFNLVHIITGVRRCGKTFYAFQLINRLLSQGVSRDSILYFNFADDRLRPASPTLLSDVVEEYWRQVPSARSQGCYLFLDEVQEAENWQGVCQRLAEHERVTLVITGSSSKLSADEIASTFRGRSQEHPMRPLSFREYCLFHDIETPSAEELRAVGAVPPDMRTQLEGAFSRYLVMGGFPGVQHMGPEERTMMLQAYMRDVVARDVVERYGRADIALATQVALFGLRNTACDLSVNNLVESLRTVGYRTSWETVNEVVRLFCQAHLLSLLPEYATSLAPSTAASKVYAVDTGLAHATARASQQDVGKRLETAVFSELERRRAGSRIETITSYTAPTSRREKVDFLVGDALASEPYELIQVTADMSAEKTRRREIGSLEVAMTQTGVAAGTIITLRENGSVTNDGGTIRIIPAWKWALEA